MFDLLTPPRKLLRLISFLPSSVWKVSKLTNMLYRICYTRKGLPTWPPTPGRGSYDDVVKWHQPRTGQKAGAVSGVVDHDVLNLCKSKPPPFTVNVQPA